MLTGICITHYTYNFQHLTSKKQINKTRIKESHISINFQISRTKTLAQKLNDPLGLIYALIVGMHHPLDATATCFQSRLNHYPANLVLVSRCDNAGLEFARAGCGTHIIADTKQSSLSISAFIIYRLRSARRAP